MNETIELMDNTNSEYLGKLNLILTYIKNNIIPSEDNPFTAYHVSRLDDPNEYYDWEVDMQTNKKYSVKEIFESNSKIMGELVDYTEKNDCFEIFNKIVFVF